MTSFRRILLATDFTEVSQSALKKAIDIAKANDAELLIAHAYQPPSLVEAESVGAGVYEEWDSNLRELFGRKLENSVAEARKAGVNARSLILPGAAYEAIVEAASQNQADLVMMGTHGRTGPARLFLGSVASRVIASAPCPVMTIRAA